MKKIGVTGGIGCGKSTVCKIFSVLGIPIYYADDAAKRLMNSDSELISKIKNRFGEEAYGKNGKLDRAYLASQVFENEKALNVLNSWVHPLVFQDFDEWEQEIRQANEKRPYLIKEAALLFESGSYKNLDQIIVVDAPKEICIQRVVERDGLKASEVEARINRQSNQENKLKKADYVILNNNEELLIPQITDLHNKFIS